MRESLETLSAKVESLADRGQQGKRKNRKRKLPADVKVNLQQFHGIIYCPAK